MSRLPIFSLVDVLSQLPLPVDVVDVGKVSRKWRCVLAPRVAAGADEEEQILTTLDRDGVPVFLSQERASAVHERCGPDGLAFACDARWNTFPKPQIAVRAGWGSPGTTLESSEYHKLIAAFDEVFHHKAAVELPLTEEEKLKEAEAKAAEAEDVDKEAVEDADRQAATAEVLEMQLFHRDDPQSCPQLPPLGNELQWPAFLDGSASIICDVDTILSQRGARRWWRLNDGGELVMQAALPLKHVTETQPVAAASSATSSRAASSRTKQLTGVTKPVKLLIFGPRGSYDWFLHDDESTTRGRIACLDLFDVPDEALPNDATLLPILTVAVLEAGGAPLLIPPNLPCTTVTLNDSVCVEQRRISHTLWLDEVSYFLHRTAQWANQPLIYEFIEKDLQDEHYVATDLIPGLMELFRRHDARTPYEETVRRRIALSLLSVAVNEKHFQLADSSRASLLSHLRRDEAFAAVLSSDAGTSYCFSAPPAPMTPAATTARSAFSLESAARLYWDTKAWWPKAGCVLQAPLLAKEMQGYSAAVKAAPAWFVPVVYNRFRPIFGTEKTSLEDTVTEYFDMKDLDKKRKELLTYLRSRKQEKDEILEELF